MVCAWLSSNQRSCTFGFPWTKVVRGYLLCFLPRAHSRYTPSLCPIGHNGCLLWLKVVQTTLFGSFSQGPIGPCTLLLGPRWSEPSLLAISSEQDGSRHSHRCLVRSGTMPLSSDLNGPSLLHSTRVRSDLGPASSDQDGPSHQLHFFGPKWSKVLHKHHVRSDTSFFSSDQHGPSLPLFNQGPIGPWTLLLGPRWSEPPFTYHLLGPKWSKVPLLWVCPIGHSALLLGPKWSEPLLFNLNSIGPQNLLLGPRWSEVYFPPPSHLVQAQAYLFQGIPDRPLCGFLLD